MMLKILLSATWLICGYLLIGFMIYSVRKNPASSKKIIKRSTDDLKNGQVDPSVYDEDYYLHAYSGDIKTYIKSLEKLPIPLARCLNYANPIPGEKILDLGCGRGHLSYFCVLKGCYAKAVDYSDSAINLALKTKEALPPDLKHRMTVIQADFKKLNTDEKYDIIFMADLLEHLYDWELKILFQKTKLMLKPLTGRLIVHTAPNRIWINLIFPLKRILDWPGTLLKGKDFDYKRDKYSYDTGMHINEQTTHSVKRLLEEFEVRVWCDDGSSNLISLLTKRFAGADIWAIAKLN
jgi:2-polyprenyl-3-methyl-5-hydroxy-6-metoxy-1,4-benzoquinol methylase